MRKTLCSRAQKRLDTILSIWDNSYIMKLTLNGVSMKKMKVREPKRDWSAYTTEQEANLESSHTTTKSSTLRVLRTEMIDGKMYKVLTVG